MFSLFPSIPFRRNLLSFRTRHLKPLTQNWMSSLKTEVVSSEREDTFDDGVRPFEDIPEVNRWKFIYNLCTKTEGFTKFFKETARLFDELGPIYKDDFMFTPFKTVHVIDPEDFAKVYRAEGKYPRRAMLDFWIEHRRRRNHFPGIIIADGEEWHRMRQTIGPKIMRPKIVEENLNNFNAVSKDAVARFIKLKETSQEEGHIPDLEKEMKRWALEGIATLVFNTRLGLYEDRPPQVALKFTEEVNNFFELSHKLLFNPFSRIARQYFDTPTFKKFLENADALMETGRGIVDKTTRELKEMTENGIDLGDAQVVPLLTYLLMKEGLTPEEVNVHAIDFVGAGVDTTSFATVWWLYNLARFPHVQQKLYQEIESVIGIDDDVTPKHLTKLHYLKASLKESMRLTPSISSMTRFLDQGVDLSGYYVPANTLVQMEFYATARSDKYFKDPLEFKPERWIRESKDVHSFSHLQFGFGPRMCVGRRVAELEMYVFMCKLLQKFRLEYHHEPLDLLQRLTTVPDKPVKIKFVDRL